MLRIKSLRLLHEDEIYEDFKLMSIQKKVELFCSWFYCMKNIVEDRFDDINIAITNNRREIELNLMGK